MRLRYATEEDIPRLARLNRELIEDEGHAIALSLGDLETRMRIWLEGEYSAVLFEEGGDVVGYALFKSIGSGVYLRQFFVARDWRRRGHGRTALALLRERVWPAGTTVTVDALARNERAVAFWRALGFTDYAITLRSGWRAPNGE